MFNGRDRQATSSWTLDCQKTAKQVWHFSQDILLGQIGLRSHAFKVCLRTESRDRSKLWTLMVLAFSIFLKYCNEYEGGLNVDTKHVPCTAVCECLYFHLLVFFGSLEYIFWIDVCLSIVNVWECVIHVSESLDVKRSDVFVESSADPAKRGAK